jgi:hypothetical protein
MTQHDHDDVIRLMVNGINGQEDLKRFMELARLLVTEQVEAECFRLLHDPRPVVRHERIEVGG